MSLTNEPPVQSTARRAGASSASPAFELKAAGFTLPVIRLLRLDLDAVEAELVPKVRQAPGFFEHTPVVIELSALPAGEEDVGFARLIGLLRGLGMIPVGVRGGSGAQHEAAKAMQLAILADSVKPDQAANEAKVEPPVAVQTAEPQVGIETGSHLIDRQVRSGQRVYAVGGDLTVLAPVNSGAELMADGNIHVYAPMRGRAMAGLHGDTTARIFCADLQAELVSIAGHYRVSDKIPAALKGRRIQIFLDHEVLRIEPL